jgi:hypothetical protein
VQNNFLRGRDADDGGVCGDVVKDDGTCTDFRMLADGDRAE